MSSSVSDWYHSDGLGYRGGNFVIAKAVVTIGTLKGSGACVPLLDAPLLLNSVCMDSICVYKYVFYTCVWNVYIHVE